MTSATIRHRPFAPADAYRLMVEHVRKVPADPGRAVPGYDAAQGYELAGFVWLHG